MAPIVNSATEAKARATLASVRSALSTERQKRILRGDFATPIADLALAHGGAGWGTPIFDYFDGNTSLPILDYPPKTCKSITETRSCWRSGNSTKYNYFTSDGTKVQFTIRRGTTLECDEDDATSGAACKSLSQ